MKNKLWTLDKIRTIPKKVASKIFLRVYIEEEGDGAVKNKYTLNEIGEALFKLTNNFEELRQEVKSINDRLDYIVKANKLEDLPKNKK